MEKQLAIAVGVVWLGGRLLVGWDVEPDEPELAVASVGVRPLQDGVPLAQRLDLAAAEREPRLDPLEQVVLVPRAAVVRDQLLALGLCHAFDCRL